MLNQTVLIVGAGQAGAETAWALRSGGFEGRILLVGREAHMPYERPPLSKKFLEGTHAPERLFLRKAGAYAEGMIDVKLETTVSALRPRDGQAELDNGTVVAFDYCVLALGAQPRHLVLPDLSPEEIRVLRNYDESVQLRDQLTGGRNVVVIGGGYMGLEIAATARARGTSVAVVEKAPQVMNRGVSPLTAAFFAERHRIGGVDLHLETEVTGVGTDRGRRLLTLSDGATVAADAIVAAVGVVPETDIASAAGLDCGDGILVDAECRTSEPNVFAVGDCAAQFHPPFGRHIRLESVQAATTHARTAAAAILGKAPPPFRHSYFWTDQYGIKLQMAGLLDPSKPSEDVLEGKADEAFTVYRFQDDILVALEAVNKPVDFVRGQMQIGKIRSVALA